MPLPAFVNLPGIRERMLLPGVHIATVDEVRETFVTAFPSSVKRPQIFQGWTTFRSLVRKFVPVQSEFIDGSFVTDRLNPEDIDLSLWIRAQDMDALPSDEANAFAQLVRRRLQFMCDAYIVPVCAQGHRLYAEFERIKSWTDRYWSTYSNLSDEIVPGITKGYVEVRP